MTYILNNASKKKKKKKKNRGRGRAKRERTKNLPKDRKEKKRKTDFVGQRYQSYDQNNGQGYLVARNSKGREDRSSKHGHRQTRLRYFREKGRTKNKRGTIVDHRRSKNQLVRFPVS